MSFYTLRNIRKVSEGNYSVTEAGFTYEFDEKSLEALKTWSTTNAGLIADWYRSLSAEDQKRIIRTDPFSKA